MSKAVSLLLSIVMIIVFVIRILGDIPNQPLAVISSEAVKIETTKAEVMQDAETTAVKNSSFTIEMFNELKKSELMAFPGIGEVTAEAILDYIELNGPFTSFDELIKVKGIGTKKLEKILLNLP